MPQPQHLSFPAVFKFLNKKFKSSSEMCDSILNNTGVALLPGSDFGFDKKGEIVLFHNVLFFNMLTFIQKELSYSVYSEFKTNFQFNKFIQTS